MQGDVRNRLSDSMHNCRKQGNCFCIRAVQPRALHVGDVVLEKLRACESHEAAVTAGVLPDKNEPPSGTGFSGEIAAVDKIMRFGRPLLRRPRRAITQKVVEHLPLIPRLAHTGCIKERPPVIAQRKIAVRSNRLFEKVLDLPQVEMGLSATSHW